MRRSLRLAVAFVLGLVVERGGAATSEVLSSFEPGGPAHMSLRSGRGEVVKDRAKGGQHSFKLIADAKEYSGLMVDAEGLKLFGKHAVLRFEVSNPQSQPTAFGIRCDDAATNSYGTRNNGEEVAAPGWSTHCINLTALNRSDAKGNTSKNLLDREAMRMCNIFLAPSAAPIAIYIDNVRLEGPTVPHVPGLRAIDFGPPQGPV